MHPSAPSCEPAELLRMIALLRHRGPDAYGWYCEPAVGLGHARLSILDLAGGSQPLANEDETIWITFNGEIFNYLELRAALERAGHQFRTRTDTEVIVHAYEEYGGDAWRRLNGQFAFGLWDGRNQRLWLVRDRLGILPLFYAQADGALVFASEIKALVAGGRLAAKFDPAALCTVFTRWAVGAPRSVFAGVRSSSPALRCAATTGCACGRTGTGSSRSRATADAGAGPSLAGAAVELAARLTAAVNLRLRADVPVGAYVSGGLDSSVIAALARRSCPDALETFAIRFEDPAFDETGPQRRMVDELRTTHHELVCSAAAIRGRAAGGRLALRDPAAADRPGPAVFAERPGCRVRDEGRPDRRRRG